MPKTQKEKSNVVWTSLPHEILEKFDEQCLKEKRKRPQLLRIILEEYYSTPHKGGKK